MWFLGSRMLPFLPRVTILHIQTTHAREEDVPTPYQNWGQRSSVLDIGLENFFPDPRSLSFPLTVTIPHMWTTHRRKMFPIDFGVKRAKVECTGHQRRNMILGLNNVTLPTKSHHITHELLMGGRCSLLTLGSKGQVHWSSEYKYGFQALECYLSHIESPYRFPQPYRLTG
jgi:hypothetical protein